MCRTCVSEILKARSPGKQRLQHSATHRTCYLCRRVRQNSEFTRRSNGTYFSACKECNRHVFAQRRRARILANGGEYSVAEWLAILAVHDRCPACKRKWAEVLGGHPKPAINRHLKTGN